MIKVVLDTNVFVSAVIKADSKPGRILELVRSGGLERCVSPDILEEIRATLKRTAKSKLRTETLLS